MTHTPALLSAAELANIRADAEYEDRQSMAISGARSAYSVTILALLSHIDALSSPVGSEEVREVIEALGVGHNHLVEFGLHEVAKTELAAISLLRRLTAPVGEGEVEQILRAISFYYGDDLHANIARLLRRLARERDEAKAERDEWKRKWAIEERSSCDDRARYRTALADLGHRIEMHKDEEHKVKQLTAQLSTAKSEGRKEMREEAANVAKAHKGSAAKKRLARGQKLSRMEEGAVVEITAEERGEDIAAEMIEQAIRALTTGEPG